MVGGAIAARRFHIEARAAATAVGAGLAIAVLVVFSQWGGNPADARAYWLADPSNPYSAGQVSRYLYAPVVIQALAPLLHLPFAVFLGLIRALELACLLALAGPATLGALWLPPVAAEINAGNINLILAACVVGGLRWPILWTLPLLVKPSSGVGLLWFAAQRQWRPLLLAVFPAMVLAIISFAYRPDLWLAWPRYLAWVGETATWPFPVPVWYRLPIAIALVVWAARTNRRWALFAGVLVAWPRLYFQSISLLVMILPALSNEPVGRALATGRAVIGSVIRHRRDRSSRTNRIGVDLDSGPRPNFT